MCVCVCVCVCVRAEYVWLHAVVGFLPAGVRYAFAPAGNPIADERPVTVSKTPGLSRANPCLARVNPSR